ncbi:virulence factor [Pseudoxanthomonas winnipegensis]|uniref:Virulence factor n=1 Tax=Pseudoxanthomonas winnipegensis TaxID=2480810 RepID=A0A4Q8LFK2_9GAMM|nr:VapE domain-containing protein [Pseudoxanthomonas winnipegensis]TAA27653.1 virulence factor [Pseudoxanthomonas winnipegensis]
MSKQGKLRVVDGGASPPPDSESWKEQLTFNRDGNVEGTLHNLILIFDNDKRLAKLWWLNDSSNQIELTRDPPWSGGKRTEFIDSDAYELAAWLQHPKNYNAKCSDEAVLKSVIAVARRYRRHPIRDYLHSLVWDGQPRVEAMLVEMFGAADTTYSRRAAQCFAVSAVARILWEDPKQPHVGAQVDFMLVLEGEQGKRKSSSLRAIFGSEWFVETSESPSGKDFYQVIQGAWGVEIGEMDSFSKGDVTSVKTAITRRVDKFRAPYERVPRSYRRECVFAGTTNEHQYLRDPTGGRRFLPVRTDGEARIEAIKAARDQLWAEAVQMFLAGFEWWLLPEDAAEQQAARYVGDSWEGRVERWVDVRSDPGKYPERVPVTTMRPGAAGEEVLTWCTTDEVLVHAIGLDPGKHGKPEQMRVANILKTLGWETARRRWPDGGREPRWFRVGFDVDGWMSESKRKQLEAVDDVPF